MPVLKVKIKSNKIIVNSNNGIPSKYFFEKDKYIVVSMDAFDELIKMDIIENKIYEKLEYIQ